MALDVQRLFMPMFCLFVCFWHLMDWFCYHQYQSNLHHGFKMDYSQLLWYQAPILLIFVSSTLLIIACQLHEDKNNTILIFNICLSQWFWIISSIFVVLAHYLIWSQKCFYTICRMIFNNTFENDKQMKLFVKSLLPFILVIYSALWIILIIYGNFYSSNSSKCDFSIKFWYYLVFLVCNSCMDGIIYTTINNVCLI